MRQSKSHHKRYKRCVSLFVEGKTASNAVTGRTDLCNLGTEAYPYFFRKIPERKLLATLNNEQQGDKHPKHVHGNMSTEKKRKGGWILLKLRAARDFLRADVSRIITGNLIERAVILGQGKIPLSKRSDKDLGNGGHWTPPWKLESVQRSPSYEHDDRTRKHCRGDPKSPSKAYVVFEINDDSH